MSYGSIVHKFSTHCELTQITFERTFSDGFVSMRLLFVHLAPTLYGVPVKSGISSRFSSTPSMTDTCFPFHMSDFDTIQRQPRTVVHEENYRLPV